MSGGVGRFMRAVADFGRLTAAGLGLSCVVIGAASAERGLHVRVLVGLLVVALCFHTAVFALNDIHDLDIDRTNPERAASPLVAGMLTTRTSYAVIGMVVAASLGADLAFFGFSGTALAVLAAGYVCLAVYDIYTKRMPWPILTDAVQGLGWAALVGYGAVRAGAVTLATVLGAAFVFGFVVLVNGVHGGLRDLPNDLAHGSHTTAIQFGARPAGSGVLVPASLRRYCWSLQIGMGAVAAVPALPGRSGWYAAGLACTVVALALCGRALRATDDKVRFKHLGATHILACYLPAMSMAAATGGWPFGLATASVMAGPMLGNPSFIAAFRTLPALVFEPPAWRRSRSDHAPAGERP